AVCTNKAEPSPRAPTVVAAVSRRTVPRWSATRRARRTGAACSSRRFVLAPLTAHDSVAQIAQRFLDPLARHLARVGPRVSARRLGAHVDGDAPADAEKSPDQRRRFG